MRRNRSAFTLIELLVVIAVIAVLSIVVILTLNPAELLKQSRDSNRLSDLATMQEALNTFSVDNTGSLGTASTTYISIPDPSATSTAGDQCQGLGLSAAPAGWTWHCASPANYRKTDGTGWMPVNFSVMSTGAPFGQLPVDLTNTSSSHFYYTYATNGTQYEVTTAIESQKYQTAATNSFFLSNSDTPIGVAAKGTNTAVESIASAYGGDSSLVAYWMFDEGSGSTATDATGNGNNGTWSGSTPYYVSPGKVGAYGGNFPAANDFMSVTSTFNASSDFTVAAWVNASSGAYRNIVGANQFRFEVESSRALECNWKDGQALGGNVTAGTYHYLACTKTGSLISDYIDGTLVATGTDISATSITGLTVGYDNRSGIGGPDAMYGFIDNVRVYNRALSQSDLSTIYNAEK